MTKYIIRVKLNIKNYNTFKKSSIKMFNKDGKQGYKIILNYSGVRTKH